MLTRKQLIVWRACLKSRVFIIELLNCCWSPADVFRMSSGSTTSSASAMLQRGIGIKHLGITRVAQSIEPESYVANSSLSFACYQLGLFDDAIAIRREALRLRPDDTFTQLNLARL